jgi:hypothetical protein
MAVGLKEVSLEEFRQDGLWRTSSEKIRKALTQGVSNDELGGRAIGVHRA